MNYDNLDLDINNYNYYEILDVLNLTLNFDESDLRKTKKFIIQLHPDKSNISSKIFIFYSELYNLVYKVWKISKNNTKDLSILINDRINQETERETINKDTIERFKNDKNFNKNFNELFTSIYVKKDDGYSEWLRSNDDIMDNLTDKETKKKFNEIKNNKAQNQSLIKTDYNLSFNSNNNIYTDDIESSNTSDIFSKLSFDDLKNVHSINPIPVNDNTYLEKKRTIKTFSQTQSERKQIIKPYSNVESNNILNRDKQNIEQKVLSQRITEELNSHKQRKNIMDAWSKYKLINN